MSMSFAVAEARKLKAQALGLPVLNRQAMVAHYVQPTMQWLNERPGDEVPMAMRQLSADAIVEAQRLKLNAAEFEQFAATFEAEYREPWLAYTAKNPGAVAYGIAQMAHSDFIMPFWKDILDGRIGRASTAPFFVLRGFDGKMHVVEPTDAAFHTCYCDRNFVSMRARAEQELDTIGMLAQANGGKVCILGGGCAPVTWAYGPLPQNVEITILDKEDYSATLKELLQVEDLADAQIRYLVGDFRETAQELKGQFDLVILNGVLAYYHGSEVELLRLARQLLAPHGVLHCDLQVKVMEDALDVLILGWPREMYVFDDAQAAKNAMADFCYDTELMVMREATAGNPNQEVAGVTFELMAAD